jgi:hypothetical protein
MSRKMVKTIISLISTLLIFSCIAFRNGSISAPVNDSLGKIYRSKSDSTKSQKQLIIAEFGEPAHKFLGVDLDTCYTYYHRGSYEEVCFNDSGRSMSASSGKGRPRQKDIKEEYYHYNEKEPLLKGFDYIAAINRALGISPIEENAGVIRLYYLASFEKEYVYEINLKNAGKVIRFAPVEGMVWTDLWEFDTNTEGDTTGGRIKKINEYNPTVLADVDTLVNDSAYRFALSLFESIGIDSLRCIRYKDIMMNDGVEIEVQLNLKNVVHKIEYYEARYKDERYNKITDLIKTKIAGLFY